MINFYITLDTIVFPIIGKFFGILGSIAMTPYKDVFDCILGIGGGFSCVNFYTGATFTFSMLEGGLLGAIIDVILAPVLSVFTICCDIIFSISPIPQAQIPFCVAIFGFAVSFGFAFGVVKFLIDLVIP